LPKLKQDAKLGDILVTYLQTAEMYHSCKLIHNNLVNTIAELETETKKRMQADQVD
jgi:hypothetical protein